MVFQGFVEVQHMSEVELQRSHGQFYKTLVGYQSVGLPVTSVQADSACYASYGENGVLTLLAALL